MKHKLIESALERDAKRKHLEEEQKVNGWGAGKWPTKADLGTTMDNIPNDSSVDPDKMLERTDGDNPSKNMFDDAKDLWFKDPTLGENIVSCCDWEMEPNDFTHAPPGSIGFNGHQAVFHCFKPGQAYIPRNGHKDPCMLKLATLATGEQVCTILYQKPPPPPPIIPRIVCRTDNQTNVIPTDFCPEKIGPDAPQICKDMLIQEAPKKTEKEHPKSAKSKKGKGGGKSKGKGKGGKKKKKK